MKGLLFKDETVVMVTTKKINKMKKLSFIFSMFVLAVVSFQAQDCIDYTLDNDDINYPGIYNEQWFAIEFDGSIQTVELGIYGDFDNWDLNSSIVWPSISVNGGNDISLSNILQTGEYNLTFSIITIDTLSINNEYLPNATVPFNSCRIYITGPIGQIILNSPPETNSGIFYSCTEQYLTEEDCMDLTLNNGNEDFPGIYGQGDVTQNFDGSDQTIDLGIYGLFNGWSSGGQQDQTFFSVNGSEPISLLTLSNNTNYIINEVVINLDTAAVDETYLLSGSGWTSGSLNFTGSIETIVMTQFESGLLFVCSTPNPIPYWACEVFESLYDSFEVPGIPGGLVDNYTLNYEGGYGEVELGFYVTDNWDNADEFLISIDGSEPISLETIISVNTYVDGDLSIQLGDDFQYGDYPAGLGTVVHSRLHFAGDFQSINVSLPQISGLIYSCPETFQPITDCDYVFHGDTVPHQGFITSGEFSFPFDSSQQVVEMGYYDYATWDQMGQEWPEDQSYFSVNGSEFISIDSILNNQPFLINDIIIELDTTSINQAYNLSSNFTSGTLTFSGVIHEITTQQTESGIAFICVEAVLEEEVCIDYTEGNDDPNAPGIYLIEGNFPLDFDSTYQKVSIGVYGFFDWENIESGQADQTFFTVNGSDSISLETIYLNQPYIINDIEITVDTTTLNSEYPLADYWPSGTLIFTGHVSELVMTQFESGLLFACAVPLDGECACQIDADFSYVNVGSYYSFISSGTGTEYSWDFGDGFTSGDEHPTHEFSAPNSYEVCMTNFNLTDTCTMTICLPVEVMAITPEANIITPNNDGFDDRTALFCGNVTVYDRNGIIVAELISQETWDGTNRNGHILPMGEYILKCNETDVIRKITIIR